MLPDMTVKASAWTLSYHYADNCYLQLKVQDWRTRAFTDCSSLKASCTQHSCARVNVPSLE